ncbi:MAG: serine/threonine protein kinase [Myxococcaceae bacterium]|nr:serine/threonine protein kinase [Myxococcaceae bacterium]
MKTEVPPAGSPQTYRASQGSIIPLHISQSRWRETAAILGSFAALTAFCIWLATKPERMTDDALKRRAEAADHAPELIAESARTTLAAAVTATVPVKVKVEADGAVSESKVETPTPALAALEARAVAAARSYHFKPAQKAGQPSDGFVTVPVRFAPMPNARRLAIRGSETIGSALGPAWAGALEAKQPEVQVEIESLGSSTGFAGLFDGSAELAASSRPIKAEEEVTAKKLGIELKSAVAGHDGIAVIVNPANPLKQLDLLTLARVFSGKLARWSEIGAGDAPIRALGRPSYSGTNGFFRERVLGKSGAFASQIEAIESSQMLTGRVVSDPNAIAYVSLSHVIPSVRSLGLSAQAGGAAVSPSPESLRDGSYPIARPLLLYWRADASRDALAYIELALSPIGQALVKQAGFVPLAPGEANPDAVAAAKNTEQTKNDEPTEVSAHKTASRRVYFDLASAGLNQQAKQELTTLAEQLKRGKRAIIVGNADASGKQTGNSQFAKRRADAVAAQLKTLGVDPISLTVQVANADQPRATNETEEGRRENRRVDVLVVDK